MQGHAYQDSPRVTQDAVMASCNACYAMRCCAVCCAERCFLPDSLASLSCLPGFSPSARCSRQCCTQGCCSGNCCQAGTPVAGPAPLSAAGSQQCWQHQATWPGQTRSWLPWGRPCSNSREGGRSCTHLKVAVCHSLCQPAIVQCDAHAVHMHACMHVPTGHMACRAPGDCQRA